MATAAETSSALLTYDDLRELIKIMREWIDMPDVCVEQRAIVAAVLDAAIVKSKRQPA
jgi:hypothetical protein